MATQMNDPNGENSKDDKILQEPPITTMNGAPVMRPAASQRIGNQLRATLLLQDINLLELIQHLTHERIPERLVHARGTSAHGYFEVTDDISDVTSAAFLNKVGKKTPLFCRFSTVAGRAGSAETVRDTRGFAFKMYTEEGNLDWLFLSTPVFPIRDGAKFPSFTHATKQNPRSGLPDNKAFWDYFTHNQEGIHFLMFLFSDRATPVDFQHADIFSINTYRFTKPGGKFVYVKIHLKTNQGVKNFTIEEATKVAGCDPDFQTRQLYEDIQNGGTPSWDVYAQIIDPHTAENCGINIFDPTKTLPFKDFPLRKFGRIVLNRNVDNSFAEQEQSAFSPTNIVPGWALTPDPILQTRALAYADTQRYRLGVNFIENPVNRPQNKAFNPLVRDGTCTVDGNLGGTPNYFPSSFYNVAPAPQYAQSDEELFQGTVVDFESTIVEADYAQARIFWEKTLKSEKDQQAHFVHNVALHLSAVTGELGPQVRNNVYDMFVKVNPDLSERIKAETEALVKANEMKGMTAMTKAMKMDSEDDPMATHGLKKRMRITHNTGMFAHKPEGWS
ncbi:catA, catalase [Fusarium austroafricanum]|uniref:CatA, catalase n=1 Tax=Fusarium austroafricanum TaxID=2364996 RepID=A0A8H4KAE9_9HYPO|nr:catA, catalase [Fusarium austroafricanum]